VPSPSRTKSIRIARMMTGHSREFCRVSSARAQVIWSNDAVAAPAAASAPGKTRSDGRGTPGASQGYDQLPENLAPAWSVGSAAGAAPKGQSVRRAITSRTARGACLRRFPRVSASRFLSCRAQAARSQSWATLRRRARVERHRDSSCMWLTGPELVDEQVEVWVELVVADTWGEES
jgi:hypothetical protein